MSEHAETAAAVSPGEARRRLLWPRPFVWPAAQPVASCAARRRACCRGVLQKTATRRLPTPLYQGVLVDESGELTLVFLGREAVPGVVCGARLEVEGMVGIQDGGFVMLNPRYRFLG